MVRVSIVIATYKRKALLEEALASIASQTMQSHEVIVIDDASGDGTKEMLERRSAADPRIRFEILQENKGATAARNRGIELATGEWVLVWDSDDLLDPNALETLLAVAAEHPDHVVVSAPTRIMRAHVPVQTRSFPTGDVEYEDVLCRMLPYNVKVRLVRRDAWEGVRYISKNVDFLVNIWLRRKGGWYHLDQELGTVRMEHDAPSLTTARKTPNLSLSIERAQHIATYLEEEGTAILSRCRSRYVEFGYGAAVGLIASKQTKRARVIIARALRAEIANPIAIPLLFLYVFALLPGSHVLLRWGFGIKRFLFRLLGFSK
jgi:glycosyltransferase involved in cell wall biosynthesis